MARALAIQGPRRPARSASSLYRNELGRTHRELLFSIEQMIESAARETFDADAYYLARIRLMQSSFERRALCRQILGYLESSAGQAEAEELERLRSRELDLLRTSANHLQRWPAGKVAADWRAYDQEVRALCSRMLRVIDDEQNLLYPLLEERGSRS